MDFIQMDDNSKDQVLEDTFNLIFQYESLGYFLSAFRKLIIHEKMPLRTLHLCHIIEKIEKYTEKMCYEEDFKTSLDDLGNKFNKLVKEIEKEEGKNGYFSHFEWTTLFLFEKKRNTLEMKIKEITESTELLNKEKEDLEQLVEKKTQIYIFKEKQLEDRISLNQSKRQQFLKEDENYESILVRVNEKKKQFENRFLKLKTDLTLICEDINDKQTKINLLLSDLSKAPQEQWLVIKREKEILQGINELENSILTLSGDIKIQLMEYIPKIEYYFQFRSHKDKFMRQLNQNLEDAKDEFHLKSKNATIMQNQFKKQKGELDLKVSNLKVCQKELIERKKAFEEALKQYLNKENSQTNKIDLLLKEFEAVHFKIKLQDIEETKCSLKKWNEDLQAQPKKDYRERIILEKNYILNLVEESKLGEEGYSKLRESQDQAISFYKNREIIYRREKENQISDIKKIEEQIKEIEWKIAQKQNNFGKVVWHSFLITLFFALFICFLIIQSGLIF